MSISINGYNGIEQKIVETSMGWNKVIGNREFDVGTLTAACCVQLIAIERKTGAQITKKLYTDTTLEVTSGTLIVHMGKDINNLKKYILPTNPPCGDKDSKKSFITIPSNIWHKIHVADRTHVGAIVIHSGYIIHPEDSFYANANSFAQPNAKILDEIIAFYKEKIEPVKRKQGLPNHPTVPNGLAFDIRRQALHIKINLQT